MLTDDYKKPTNFSGGISVGGADLGTDRIPQPQYIGVRLTQAKASRTFRLPAGTVIDSWRIVPATPAPANGTVDAGPSATPDGWLDGEVLTAVDEDVLVAAVTLSADTDVVIAATGLDGDVLVMFRVQHPSLRV
jgi:hypothetical protein